MNQMQIALLLMSFTSVILTSLPAGAWVYAGGHGVVVAPKPSAVYVAPRPALFM